MKMRNIFATIPFTDLYQGASDKAKKMDKRNAVTLMWGKPHFYKIFVMVLCFNFLRVSGNTGNNSTTLPQEHASLRSIDEPLRPIWDDWALPQCFEEKDFELVFLYDVSSAVRQRQQAKNVLQFFDNIVQVLDFGRKRNKVTFVSFDIQVRKVLNFESCNRRNCLENFIENSANSTTKRGMRLSPALRFVRRRFFNYNSKLRRKQSNSPIVLVIVVDQKPLDNPQFISSLLRSAGSRIVTVVYKPTKTATLRSISSTPIKENFFHYEFGSSLPVEGAAAVSSLLCEEVINKAALMEQRKRVSILKQSTGLPPQSLLRLKSAVSTSSSIRISWRPPFSLPTNYFISHTPSHGTSLRVNNTAVLKGLRPSTIYKITIRPSFNFASGLPTVFVFTTAPPEISNITIDAQQVEGRQLQDELKEEYQAQSGLPLLPSNNITVLNVSWNTFSNDFLYEVYTVPPTPDLLIIPKKSNRRVFMDTSPGTLYTVYVVTRLPRLESRSFSSASIITPPAPPQNAEVLQSNFTSMVVRWGSPRAGVFDSFLLIIQSLHGRVIHVVEASDFLVTINETNTTFNYTVNNVLPSTVYRVKVYSRSRGILSDVYSSVSYTTDSPQQESVNVIENLQNSLLITSSEGIYSFPLGSLNSVRTDERELPLQEVLSVPSGVVSAIYHRRAMESATPSNLGPHWMEMIIWIKRRTREIKITTLGPNTRTTTLLNGLLQPVGMAIDHNDKNIYWTDIGSQSLGVASLNYPGFPEEISQRFNRRLISGGGMTAPTTVAIDSVNRRLFWGDLIGRIEMSSMTGQGRSLLVNNTTLRPYAITYCVACNKLYWMNAVSDQLEAYAFDGSGHQVVVGGATGRTSGITFLTSFQNDLIWLNSETLLLKQLDDLKLSKSNGSPNILVRNQMIDLPEVTSISAYSNLQYETAFDVSNPVIFPCSYGNHECTEVCISTSVDESLCTGQCQPWEMLCFNSKPGSVNKTCVNSLLICDGVEDCPNGEDESASECSIPDGSPCHNHELLHGVETVQCGSLSKCISATSLCDGRINCRDGSDEENCPVQAQFCDFEGHLCLWTQDADDEFDWSIHHGHTPSNYTGPAMDHTLIDTNSNYIYIEATDEDIGSTAVLTSVWLVRPVCVKFYYHMLGTSVGSLSLGYRKYDSMIRSTDVWRKDGNQGVFWRTAEVSVNQHGLYQLMFVAMRGTDFRGDIALDDVTISDGLCDVSRTCAFERFDDSVCGYEIENTNPAGWQFWSGPTPSLGTGPLPYVHHIEEVMEPQLTSPLSVLGPEWFYFNFEYDDIPGCSACNGTRLVRKLSGYEGPTLAGVILCDTTKYKIFLGETLRGTFRNIGDGTGKGGDHCEYVAAKSEAIEVGDYSQCQGAIGYVRRAWGEPVTLGPFGYLRAPSVSPAYYKCDVVIPQEVIDNDPSKRASRRPDRYFYIESDELEEGQTATFTVPVSMATKKREKDDDAAMKPVTPNSKSSSSSAENSLRRVSSVIRDVTQLSFLRWCLTFRYHMHGQDVGSLRIRVNENTDIWFKEGNQGPDWILAIVTIPAPTVKFNLFFVATGGGGDVGDIAVDDVTIKEYPCHRPQNYSCEFNSHIRNECAFSITPNPNKMEYIKVDQLFGRRIFDPVVVESQQRASGVLNFIGSVAEDGLPVLRSPILPGLSPLYPVYCLTINYMQHLNRGNLSITLRSVDSNATVMIEHHQLPEVAKVNPWLSMAVEVNSTLNLARAGSFVLEFVGAHAVYVDSITVMTDQCSKQSEGYCNNAVSCGSKSCVSPEQLCDGFNDCGDWSDEVGCSSHCGSVADIFGDERILINASSQHSFDSDQCVWRIHGDADNDILIEINVDEYTLQDKFSLSIFGEFASRDPTQANNSVMFEDDSTLLFKNNFQKPSKYLIQSSRASVVLDFIGQSSDALISIQVSQVDKNHCNYLCSDLYCVTDNYECDGIAGCPDGSDENNCTRFNEAYGETLFEVKRLNGDYSVICAEDMNDNLANAACIQQGYSKAELPLRFVSLPPGYKRPHRLEKILPSDFPEYIQAYVVLPSISQSPEKSNDEDACESGRTWIAKCEAYQCGVKSIRSAFNPVLRIVGGDVSRRASWPWVVSLLLFGSIHKCGGTLISDRLVLTAAHCFDENPPEDFVVVVGANRLIPLDDEARIYSIQNETSHRNYIADANIPDWDISILELNKPVVFSPFVSPACLPRGNARFRPGTRCYVVGYGHLVQFGTDPNRLYEVETPLLTYQQCNIGYYTNSISPRMMCAGYPDVGLRGFCNGDSGGPLMCEADDGKWILTGIVSWSFGCASAGNPDVFTRVQFFSEWLNTNAHTDLEVPDFLQQGTCGGLFTATNGSIASPGWPNHYPDNAECVYRILGGPGQTIRLTFETLDTEGGHYDAVELYSGAIHPDASIAYFTGPHSGQDDLTFEIADQNLEVVFYSDSATTNRGFFARYTIEGSKTTYSGLAPPIEVYLGEGDDDAVVGALMGFTGVYRQDGTITGKRPSYTQDSSFSQIDGSSRGALQYNETIGQWRFTHFNSEASGIYMYANDSSVTPDRVRAFWVIRNEDTEINTTLSIQTRQDLETTTVEMTTTNMTNNVTSFPTQQITQEMTDIAFVNSSDCFVLLNSNNGVISSPGFPSTTSRACRWRVAPNYDSNDFELNQIVLVIEYFNAGSLNFYSGMLETAQPPLYTIGGTIFPDQSFLSSYNTTVLEEVQSQSSSQSTSSLAFTDVVSDSVVSYFRNSISACSELFTNFSEKKCTGETYYHFASFNATSSLLDCTLLQRCVNISWCRLNVLLSSYVADSNTPQVFSEITTSYCQDPNADSSATSIGSMSSPDTDTSEESNAEETPESHMSSLGRKTVLFYEDKTESGLTLSFDNFLPSEGEGFFFRYFLASEDVRSLYNEETYNLINITRLQSHRVERSVGNAFSSLSTSSSLFPSLPGLSFFRNAPFLTSFRSSQSSFSSNPRAPAIPRSAFGSSISISLHPISSPVCAATITLLESSSSSWIITSPNFPDPYDVNTNCTWTITAQPGYSVVVEFSNLLLENHRSCQYDALTLYDGDSTNFPIINTFCPDTYIPIAPQESSGAEMTLHFYSDNFITKTGFRAVVTSEMITYDEEPPSEVAVFSCDFSLHYCGFVDEVATPGFTWDRQQFATTSDGTGPNFDSSADGQGWYLYVEASSPRLPGDTARIVSPLIQSRPDRPLCLRFAHDMHGPSIGMLNVYVSISLIRNHTASIYEGDGTESVVSTQPLVYLYGNGVGKKERQLDNETISTQRYLLWSRSREQRRASDAPWKLAAVTFHPFNDFQIIFEGVRGLDYQSDIAIDNVEITEGECTDECETEDGFYRCSVLAEDPLSGECISMEKVCNGKADCRSGSDEQSCSSAIRNLCESDTSVQPNTTAEVVCSPKVVDGCGLRSPFFSRVSSIVCDGVFDCFGGFDESLCLDPTEEGNFTTVNYLSKECGYQSVELPEEMETDYPNASSTNSWPWVAGLYVATPTVEVASIEEEEEESQSSLFNTTNLMGYTFLCSTVFIRPKWLVVAAHCLLNPSTYDDYVSGSQQDAPHGTRFDMGNKDLNKQLDEESTEQFPEEEPRFSYAVITPNYPQSGATRSAWRVKKSIIHPNYKPYSGSRISTPNITDDDETTASSTEEDDPSLDMLRADTSMINFDIALLYVEPDDSILLHDEGLKVEVTEFETDIDTETEYPMYFDTEMSLNNATTELETASVCLEVFQPSNVSGERGNIRHPGIDSGAFKLPLEEQRFGANIPSERRYPNRATCIVVGHSPVRSGVDGVANDRHSWGLRHFETPVTSADVSSYFVFCDAYKEFSMRKRCVETLTSSSSSLPESSPRINVLMRSGFKNKRTAAFANDQGTVVLCKRFDGRWFLAGTFSWINLRRNFITPNYPSIIHHVYSTQGTIIQPVLGVPLGTDYYTKLTPSLNEWISSTLQVACPGEFACFPPDSSRHLCITLEKVCDGIIDCSGNFADEINCDSGCFYDPSSDPVNKYYERLKRSGERLPENLLPSLTTINTVNQSWRSKIQPEDGIQTIRTNRITRKQEKTCRWSILPPEGKVAVIRIPKMNANPIIGGGQIEIIAGTQRMIVDWTVGNHYYTSLPNQPITILLAPNPEMKYLTAIRNMRFDYYVEDESLCSEQHRCGNGKCVSPLKVCDGELDCEDFSDEYNCPSGCEGLSLHTGVLQGRISSRNYPFPHTGNGDCVWMILAHDNIGFSTERKIRVEFLEFSLSSLDLLYVYTGVGKSKTIYEIYSSGVSSFNVTIPAEQATLLLRSNDGIAERRINGRFYIADSSSTVN